jgi:hypothetical protein
MLLTEIASTPADRCVQRVRELAVGDIAFPELSVRGKTTVRLEAIWAQEPGKGQGSKGMRILCDAADEFGVTIELEVHWLSFDFEEPPMRNSALEVWYQKFGFRRVSEDADIDIESGEVRMTRKPR